MIDNAEDLDIVMSMYNLFEYSDMISMTYGSLWIFYRDEVDHSPIEINDNDNMINNSQEKTDKYFLYKTKNNRKHIKYQ